MRWGSCRSLLPQPAPGNAWGGQDCPGPGSLPPHSSTVPAGMGLPTMSATRIYKGQLAGGSGEETVLAMETFPHVALAKVSGAAPGRPCCPCLKPH